MAYAHTREEAHALIDRIAPSQVSAVVGLLETLLDPFARALAHAPYDDEPVSEEDEREAQAARESLARGEGTSHEELLTELGLTEKDFAGIGR